MLLNAPKLVCLALINFCLFIWPSNGFTAVIDPLFNCPPGLIAAFDNQQLAYTQLPVGSTLTFLKGQKGAEILPHGSYDEYMEPATTLNFIQRNVKSLPANTTLTIEKFGTHKEGIQGINVFWEANPRTSSMFLSYHHTVADFQQKQIRVCIPRPD